MKYFWLIMHFAANILYIGKFFSGGYTYEKMHDLFTLSMFFLILHHVTAICAARSEK